MLDSSERFLGKDMPMRTLKYQFQLIQAMRNFFHQKGFIDVLTPPMVENPGMEVHIHPFKVLSARNGKDKNLFLHTSPEFAMKKLLAEKEEEFSKIFTISYCFRDELKSPIHRPQFLMLEWYRRHEHYESIMQDVKELITFTQETFASTGILKNKITSFPQITVQELFLELLGLDILNFLNSKDLEQKIRLDYKEVPLPEAQCHWDDYYFLLFLNKIEPHLVHYPYLLLKEFPAPLSALSTIKADNTKVCERFEVYLKGIELCNCFNELIDFSEQSRRFNNQQSEKKSLYNYQLPWPHDFMSMMERGLPQSAGIALGVERLLYCLLDIENPFFR